MSNTDPELLSEERYYHLDYPKIMGVIIFARAISSEKDLEFVARTAIENPMISMFKVTE